MEKLLSEFVNKWQLCGHLVQLFLPNESMILNISFLYARFTNIDVLSFQAAAEYFMSIRFFLYLI